MIAVLLTALLVVPVFRIVRAEEAFAIDQRCVLEGMTRSYLQGCEPSVSRNTMTLVLPVVSSLAEGAVQAEIILKDESLSPFPNQEMTAEARRPENGIWALRFSLKLFEDRVNGDYAADIRITGKDKDGKPLCADLPYVFRIRDGAPSAETARMRLEEVRSDFRVGEDGMISVTLVNPCHTVPFERPVLRVSDASGEIIPQTAGALYLEDMAPGQSVTVDFPMTVLPKAAVSPHILRFDMSWTALGQEVSQSESYTVAVAQEIRLEQGGLKIPPASSRGIPSPCPCH